MKSCRWIAALLLIASLSVNAKVIERIVAIVNDQVITLTEIERYKKKLSSDGFVDEALLRIIDKDKLLKDRDALVNHMIDERILDYEVKKKGLEITIERVEQEIRGITKRQNISRTQLKDALVQRDISFAEYQDFIKSSIERQSLIEREVSSKIKISDEDAAAYYLNKKGPSKSQAYEYTLAHILFLSANGGEAAAKSRAEQVLQKIGARADTFERLAEQYSEDPNFAKDGLLGTFKTGEMMKELEVGVRELGPGDVSSIIKTRVGFDIIKVLRRTVTSDPEFERQKEDIRNLLFNEAFRRQFRNWIDQRRDEAFIRIN